MRAREFEVGLASMGPWTRSALDQCTRQLREAGLLPVGGRGPHAPDIDAEHAAAILIALGATDQASGMHLVVSVYSGLEIVGGRTDFLGNRRFGETFAKILKDPEGRYRITEVRINRTWPEVEILRAGGGGELVIETYRRSDAPETGYGRAAHVECVLNGSLLSQAALDITQPEESGDWTVDV